MLIHWIIFGFLLLLGSPGGIANAQDDSTAALLGEPVVLTCPIDVTSCGELHSVRWFRGSERIAAVSGDGNVANVDSKYSQRMNIQHSSSGPSTRLEIKSTKIEDEGIYKCDITFLHPLDTCFASGGYRIDLKIHVKPSEIHVFDEHGKNIENGKVLGPVREKHKLQATCEAKGARPAPTVTWLQNGKQLGVEFAKPTIDEALGLFTVKSELSVVLQRQHLGADFECRVETPALTDPVSNHLQLDLQVGPTTVELSGVEDHAVQGANVLLKCKVEGARPAANVTWYNGTQEISADVKDVTEIEAESHQQKDGTFVTISKLLFIATRFDNEKVFKCEAENLVTKELGLKPVFEILDLQVMYPPVVTVRPENHTANEYESVLLFCDYHANPGTLKAVVWLKDGQPVDVSSSRYDGGELEHTGLVINNVSRSDIGVYACNLTNMINSSLSENEISLDVHFPPTVQLQMDPDGPVIENMEANVTLYCNIIEGNPPTLLKVRWILEGNLLKELPDCKPNSSPDGEDLCNIDPSKLLLQNIGREFLGNYSCEGYNAAGWGPRSPENDLIVYYEPGNATLVHYPLIPLKNENVSFTCSIEDPGYPPATKFRWLRGGAVVKGHNDSVYNVTAVGLKDRTNFSCLAYNDGGDGNMAVVDLEVHVPPFFITKMKPYSGALYSDKNASLTCRVECVPECSIVWFKNSVGIEKNSDKYYFVEEYMKAVPATGDFESISSTLHFNMSAWPNQEFDIKEDNSNYSCSSTDNPVGPGVRSVTYFSIEYPPENANISDKFINVTEGDVPPRVLCSANGNPEPVYKWVFNYDVISNDSALIINEKMSREDSGKVTCVAYNKHGTTSIKTFINVLYTPSCDVVRKEIKDEDTLTCTGKGNPDDLHYTWSIKNENDSAKMLNVRPKGQQSRLILDDDFSVTRTYVCIANNELGVGTPCEIEVAGRLPWYQRWDKTTIIILVVAIITVILSAIALCIIIICICRRKRRQDKYHTDVSICATQSVLSYQASSPLPSSSLQAAPEIPKSPPKWPLRPGVMVHVKGDTKQNLCANRTTNQLSSPSNPAAPTTTTIMETPSTPSCTSTSITTTATISTPPKSSLKPLSMSPLTSIEASTISSSVGIPLTSPATSLPRTQGNRTTPNEVVNTRDLERCAYSTMKPVPRRPPKPSYISTISAIRAINSSGATANPPTSPVKMSHVSTTSPNNKKVVTVNPGSNPSGSIQRTSSGSDAKNSKVNDDTPPPILPRKKLPTSVNSTNRNNCSGTSTNELLPKSRKRTSSKTNAASDDDDDSAIGCRPLQVTDSPPTVALGHGRLFERIFGEIFSRNQHRRSDSDDLENGGRRTFRDEVRNLFGITKVFGRQKLGRSDSGASNPFATEHRLKGIRCSSGVVTYKKTPVLERPALIDSNSNALLASETTPRNESDPTKTINGKSSTLADPLTEPGEYENLPFHGLQTAPNKFTTTPLNLNSTNVVRVAPRPKLINNNQQQSLLQQQYKLQQQSLNNPSSKHPFSMSTASSQTLLLSSSNTLGGGGVGGNTVNSGGPMGCGGGFAGPNKSSVGIPNSNNYDLSNCFPTSYTAYYHHQQQKNITGNPHMGNSLINSHPYTVENPSNANGGNATSGVGVSSSRSFNNPFLATNFKKFNTNSGCRQGVHRKKPDGDKKFYSLKSLGNKKSLHFSSMKPSLMSAGDKCKRHHSFAGGSIGDIVSTGTSHTLPYITQTHTKMKFYEPPLYENLTDSIQIHESSIGHQSQAPNQNHIQNHSQAQPYQQRHHQHQHQQMDDYNNLEPERLSIYRSDSGISNSSYECVTPVPAPRQQLLSSSTASGKSQSSKFQNGPVYMNISSGTTAGTTTPSSSHSSTTTPSSSNPIGHSPNCNSVNSSVNNNISHTGNSCNNHCNGANSSNQSNNNAYNQKEKHHYHHQQNQQQSQSQGHPQSQSQPQQHHHHHHQKQSSNNRKCKKRTQSSSSLINLERNASTNPFLATSSGAHCINGPEGMGNSTNRCRQHQPDPHHGQQQQQQMLLPKELFPLCSTSSSSTSSQSTSISTTGPTNKLKSNLSDTKDNPNNYSIPNTFNYNSDTSLTSKISGHKTKGYCGRPIKLPLRKHHSFHFHPSQTVATTKFRMKQQQQQQQQQQQHQPHSVPSSQKQQIANYKQNGGPLVFKPFFNEKNAFKPITPASATGISTNSTNSSSSNRLGSNSNIISNSSVPRICGTSLKRHMSNVESYDSNRYSNSLSSPKLNINDEEEIPDNVDNDEVVSDEDDVNCIGDDDDDDSEVDEIIITQEAASSSSNSTLVGHGQGKRLVYADLAPLSSNGKVKNPNYRNHSSTTNTTTTASSIDDFDDLTINSDSEQLRRSNRLRQQQHFHQQQHTHHQPHHEYHEKEFGNLANLDSSDTTIIATPTRRTTQYATLKFNEPLSPQDLIDDLDYADVDYRSYGPINYKAASIYALVKKDKKDGKLKEVNPEKEK